jgi:hypothetical protein
MEGSVTAINRATLGRISEIPPIIASGVEEHGRPPGEFHATSSERAGQQQVTSNITDV